PHGWTRVADLNRAFRERRRGLEPRSIAIVELQHRIAGAHFVARLGAHDDADREIDRILDLVASRAQGNRGTADELRVESIDESTAAGDDCVALRRCRQASGIVDDARIAAL